MIKVQLAESSGALVQFGVGKTITAFNFRREGENLPVVRLASLVNVERVNNGRWVEFGRLIGL